MPHKLRFCLRIEDRTLFLRTILVSGEGSKLTKNLNSVIRSYPAQRAWLEDVIYVLSDHHAIRINRQ